MLSRFFKWLARTPKYVDIDEYDHTIDEVQENYERCFLCLYEIVGGYSIVKRDEPLDIDLDWAECLSEKDEDRAVRIWVAGYQRKGKIVVNTW